MDPSNTTNAENCSASTSHTSAVARMQSTRDTVLLGDSGYVTSQRATLGAPVMPWRVLRASQADLCPSPRPTIIYKKGRGCEQGRLRHRGRKKKPGKKRRITVPKAGTSLGRDGACLRWVNDEHSAKARRCVGVAYNAGARVPSNRTEVVAVMPALHLRAGDAATARP